MSAAAIFGVDAEISTQYRAVLRFKHLVVGGVPSNPSVIRAWIRTRMELGDAAIQALVQETVQERGVFENPERAIDAVMDSDLVPSINGFKRDADGTPCLEGRCVKAALKEWMNSAYPGTAWPGKTVDPNTKALRKGLMRYGAETIFVPEVLIPLRDAAGPLATEERIKHVMTPQGPRSSINCVEVVPRASVSFTVQVRDDFLNREAWGRVWAVGENIGLGADRGRSDGMFTLESWEKI